MFIYYTVQAHEDTIAFTSAFATELEAQTTMAEVLYDQMDHALLNETGHVDLGRVRLLYRQTDPYRPPTDWEGLVPYHPLPTDGVHFLNGPTAGEFERVPVPTRLVRIPVIGDGFIPTAHEYKVERLNDLYFGVYLGQL